MLKHIFKTIYKTDTVFDNYEKVNNKVISVLKTRANITSPSQKEITENMDKVLDSRLIMKIKKN